MSIEDPQTNPDKPLPSAAIRYQMAVLAYERIGEILDNALSKAANGLMELRAMGAENADGAILAIAEMHRTARSRLAETVSRMGLKK